MWVTIMKSRNFYSTGKRMRKHNTFHAQTFCEVSYLPEVHVWDSCEISRFLMCAIILVNLEISYVCDSPGISKFLRCKRKWENKILSTHKIAVIFSILKELPFVGISKSQNFLCAREKWKHKTLSTHKFAVKLQIIMEHTSSLPGTS